LEAGLAGLLSPAVRDRANRAHARRAGRGRGARATEHPGIDVAIGLGDAYGLRHLRLVLCWCAACPEVRRLAEVAIDVYRVEALGNFGDCCGIGGGCHNLLLR